MNPKFALTPLGESTSLRDIDCRNPQTHSAVVRSMEQIFADGDIRRSRIKHIAHSISEGIRAIDPFIREANRSVCARCKDVCCVSKHGYHNAEDILYLCALGIEPPSLVQGRDDAAPCHNLQEDGCALERWLRPSACTWYFCDPLLHHMEAQPGYRAFDDIFRNVAESWIEMVDEFRRMRE